MCGRFNLRTNPATLVQMFLPQMDAGDLPPLPPRYNIAPTQQILGVTGDAAERRSLRFFRWGLVPPWADSLSIGARMINARSETITEKRSFRGPFASRRCLIPASGYYEWLTLENGSKQPIHIHRSGDGLLAMAGLWEENRKASADENPVFSCTVLTTSANEKTAPVHERMPVFLEGSGVDAWLDPDSTSQQLQDLCRPIANDRLECTPVSPKVNRAGYDDPQCIVPIKLTTQQNLFET